MFKIKQKDIFYSLVFILPALIGVFVFILVPAFFSFSLSFADWDLLNKIKFVGFDNYIALIKDRVFFKVLANTVIYALGTSVFAVIIPLVLAFIINLKVRCSEFYKTAYFLPFITPMIVIAIVWQWIFDPNIGPINQILHLNIKWLYDSNFAMPAVIIVSVWKLIGYNIIIFLSGFANINNSLIEAAKIDGASDWKIFKSIIIPILFPTILFVIVITSISSFQVFDLIYMMTQGGPLDSTNVLVYYVYKNAFEYFKVGNASAIAYVLFFIVLVFNIVQWKISNKIKMDY